MNHVATHANPASACNRCRVMTAMADPLTGFPRLPFFLDRVTHHLVGQAARRQPMSLVLLDIDRFRTYNLFLGNASSDLLLSHVAALISAETPAAATRVHADRFAMLVPRNRETTILASLRRRLSAPLLLSGSSIRPSISMGVAHLPAPSADDALRDAEMALAVAKAEGRGLVRTCSDEMRKAAREKVQLEALLPQALRAGEFWLAYQPIVHLSDRSVAGYEALMRWTSPEFGDVPPRVFIPIAEDSALIVELGEFAFSQALASLSHLPGEQFVSVNLAPRQLADEAHVARLLEMLADVPQHVRARLALEVTESTMIADPAIIVGLLDRFRSFGCRVSLDDFGTGYSSLSMLHDLRFETIKLDRAFVSRGGSSEIAQPEIAGTVARLAKALQANLVAEGVETNEQAEFLAGIGCRYGQGWLFGRPDRPQWGPTASNGGGS